MSCKLGEREVSISLRVVVPVLRMILFLPKDHLPYEDGRPGGGRWSGDMIPLQLEAGAPEPNSSCVGHV